MAVEPKLEQITNRIQRVGGVQLARHGMSRRFRS
jgi:hypothetical protein